MSLTERQNAIVEALKGENFVTAAELVRVTKGAPFASIRRNIAALRKKGYDIQTSDDRSTSGYRLIGVLPTKATVAPARNITLADLKADLELGEDTLPGIDPYEGEDDEADVNDYDDGGW